MNVKIKEAIAASISILVLTTLIITNLGHLLSPVGGVWNSSNQAYYPEYMEVKDPSLGGQILVYRDNMGIPHIYTSSEADFAFAIGYVQAQDRLFAIDVQRRFVKGQVSELIGEDFLGYDKQAHLIGFERLGAEMWTKLQSHSDPEAPNMCFLLQRFCDGINRYISDITPNKLSMEYLYLGLEPTPFTPEDICSFASYFSYMLSFASHDLSVTRLADALGKDTLFEIMPYELFPFDVPIIPDFSAPADTGEPLVKGSSESEEDLSLKATLAEVTLEKMEYLVPWIEKYGGASNNWVVNGSLTTTGYPILCNDPHLQYMLPPIWWEFHYVNTITGESLYGVAFPGTPLCEIGVNNFIAWGATITAVDCVDFYAETLDSKGEKYLFNKTQWRDIHQVNEIIKVKNKPNVHYTINFTKHDYVGDDFYCPIYTTHDGYAVSVKWPGFEASPGIAFAFWKIDHARNITEFQNALRYHSVPGINFVFASVHGDIGMFPCTARYPVRNATGSIKDGDGYPKGILILNGSNGEDEWTGYIPFEWIPQKINPEQMYLQSANQRTVNTSEYQKYYLAWRQAEGYRGRAIDRYLKNAEPHSITVEDMQRLQADVFDVAASVIIPELLEAVNTYYYKGISEPFLNQTVEILTAWNQSGTYADRAEIGATIWDKFHQVYRDEIFYDEWADAGIPNERKPQFPAVEYLTRYNTTSHWFNDTRTTQTENASDIMLRALNKTITDLRNSLGDDMTEWKWGSLHQIEIRYLEGMLPEFNIPKYPADGNGWTINVAGGHNVHGGPSMRMVIDLSNLAKNETWIGYLSYPGGQSGNPLSPHYRDSFELWKNYQYHGILFPLSIEDYPSDYIEATVVFNP